MSEYSDYEFGRKMGIIAYNKDATESDKNVIAFGMSPAWLFKEYDIEDGEMGRGFAVGLMEAAGPRMVV